MFIFLLTKNKRSDRMYSERTTVRNKNIQEETSMKTTKTRKKYKIVSKFRFTMFLTVIFAVGLFVGGVTGMYDASSMSEPLYTEVCVQSGDTLWDLAGSYGPQDEDVRKVVHAICKVNNISANNIHPGQTLQIPVSL